MAKAKTKERVKRPRAPEETQTIIMGLRRNQTLVLPDGQRIPFRKPAKNVRKGNAVLTVPLGTRIERHSAAEQNPPADPDQQ